MIPVETGKKETQGVIGTSHRAPGAIEPVWFQTMPSSSLKKDSTFGVVESVKSVSDIFSPLTGEVIAANNEVIDAPELINQDPYGKGWLVKIKMADKSELDSLLNAKEYEDITEQE